MVKNPKASSQSHAENDDNSELRRADLNTVHLGRYPFRASIRYYCAFQEGNLSPTTMDVDKRKLTQFAGVFEQFKFEKRIVSTDPRKFTQSHITEFMIWMKSRGVNLSTQEKYLQILDRLLQIFGNHIIGDMRGDPLVHMPKGSRGKAIRALTIDELQKVFDAADNMPGYDGMILRGYISIAFGTGCRPKEIIGSMLGDVSLKDSMYYVRHPKGEGSWAEPQWIPIIRGDMIPKIQAFLAEWDNYLFDRGVTSEYLFVNPETGLPLTDYSLRRMKQRLEKESGVNFKLKDFRSTLASLLVEGDLSRLPAVSLQLRHKSVDTTSTYYTRINKNKEIKEALEEVWKKKKIK